MSLSELVLLDIHNSGSSYPTRRYVYHADAQFKRGPLMLLMNDVFETIQKELPDVDMSKYLYSFKDGKFQILIHTPEFLAAIKIY